MADVVGEGNSQWKEETRPRYEKWSRPVMNDGGVWCGRRGECLCVLGEGKEAGETGWDQRGSDAS